MALDAVIFDVDGTLVDNNWDHIEAWRRAFENRGFAIAEDRIAVEVGKGGDKLVDAILGPTGEEEHGDALREDYGQEFLKIAGSKQFQPFPKLRELLLALRERGLKTALATSSDKKYFDAIQNSVGIDLQSLVDLVTTKSDAAQSKPAPDLVASTVEKLGVSPAQCVMIGDTPYDVESAKHAGVVCLGVFGGAHSGENVLNAGARKVWRDIGELFDDLDEALLIASPGSAHLTHELMESLMREALAAAREGMENGEVPIGAVLAKGDGTVLARGYNELNRSQNPTAHAETVTFAHAAGTVPVEARDLILVTTLEPCVMCLGAAMEASVDTVVFGLQAPADNGTTRVRPPRSPESQMPRIVGGILATESRTLFTEWLRRNGETPQTPFVRQLLEATEDVAE